MKIKYLTNLFFIDSKLYICKKKEKEEKKGKKLNGIAFDTPNLFLIFFPTTFF